MNAVVHPVPVPGGGSLLAELVNLVATARVDSLLDRPVDDWVQVAIATGRAGPAADHGPWASCATPTAS